MAYAPAAGATRTASRTPGTRSRTSGERQRPEAAARTKGPGRGNGRPGSRSPAVPVVTPRRPSVTFLAGLGVGLAIGVAAALLMAPKSGADTRRALRNRSRKLGSRARDAWEDLRIELEATRRALKRKRRDAKVEIEEEKIGGSTD
jgi:hypothetical protein